MKRLVITTIILLIATAAVTVYYFKNLNPPGAVTNKVMSTIPDNAALVFGFNNEKGYYDIFSSDTLLAAVTGKTALAEIDTLRSTLLENPLLQKYFDGQNLFISLHPLKDNNIALLLSIGAGNNFDNSVIEKLAKNNSDGLIINAMKMAGKEGYSIYIKSLKKRFYIIEKEDNIFSGSFSEELIQQAAAYNPQTEKKHFVMLPEQQNSNSLANLYVNYSQLKPLFDQLFSHRNTDILSSLRSFPALAVLSLNYRSDAFMFNGITDIEKNDKTAYLDIFARQQPVENHLKDIFPATTAFNTNFAVSDISKFSDDLQQWQKEAGYQTEGDALLSKVKAETGISLRKEFYKLLGNEFAVLTTRFQERFAIIQLKDGSKLSPVLANISTMKDGNTGQFNYDKLPFFLLGEAFDGFRHPYFLIVDNYLVLANSASEITSYNDTYFNRKFLSKMSQYNQFDDLISGRSNVNFFINFKNTQPIFKEELDKDFYSAFEKYNPGWKNFYAASYQLSAADKNFYTNFCLKLNNIDTAAVER